MSQVRVSVRVGARPAVRAFGVASAQAGVASLPGSCRPAADGRAVGSPDGLGGRAAPSGRETCSRLDRGHAVRPAPVRQRSVAGPRWPHADAGCRRRTRSCRPGGPSARRPAGTRGWRRSLRASRQATRWSARETHGRSRRSEATPAGPRPAPARTPSSGCPPRAPASPSAPVPPRAAPTHQRRDGVGHHSARLPVPLASATLELPNRTPQTRADPIAIGMRTTRRPRWCRYRSTLRV